MLICFFLFLLSGWFSFPLGILDLLFPLQFSASCICLGVFTPVLGCYGCQGEVASLIFCCFSYSHFLIYLCLALST